MTCCLTRFHAFARTARVRWVIVGDGPLRPSLQPKCNVEDSAPPSEFVGAVSDDERDAWLTEPGSYDAKPHPPGSMSGEGFGIVYLEAGAHGVPVLAGNVGGALDAVKHEETGFWSTPRIRLLSARIARLLTDKQLAARFGAAGASAHQTFAWRLIAARVQEEMLDLHRHSRGHGRSPVLPAHDLMVPPRREKANPDRRRHRPSTRFLIVAGTFSLFSNFLTAGDETILPVATIHASAWLSVAGSPTVRAICRAHRGGPRPRGEAGGRSWAGTLIRRHPDATCTFFSSITQATSVAPNTRCNHSWRLASG